MKTVVTTLRTVVIVLSLTPLAQAENNKEVIKQEQASDESKSVRSAELALQVGQPQPYPATYVAGQ